MDSVAGGCLSAGLGTSAATPTPVLAFSPRERGWVSVVHGNHLHGNDPKEGAVSLATPISRLDGDSSVAADIPVPKTTPIPPPHPLQTPDLHLSAALSPSPPGNYGNHGRRFALYVVYTACLCMRVCVCVSMCL